MNVMCVCLSGGRRQQPVLLEKLVFLYKSAENIEQADQVETLQDNGELFCTSAEPHAVAKRWGKKVDTSNTRLNVLVL